MNNTFENNKALSVRYADGTEFLKNKTVNGQKLELEFENCANVMANISEQKQQ